MINEKMLFVVHKGTVAGETSGIIMLNYCLPIACSHSSWDGHGVPVAEAGIYSLWEASRDVEDFFEALGIRSVRQVSEEEPNGLWVYEVSYDDEDVRDDDDMDWLQGGSIRRPTVEELEPLTRGEAPWGGVVL